MKYYLIKAPENHLIYVEGKRNREAECVELTQDDYSLIYEQAWENSQTSYKDKIFEETKKYWPMNGRLSKDEKEMKKFNKDLLKWICMHVGQEIELPKKEKPSTRYFVVRFDNGVVDWKFPDFVEELRRDEVETIAVEGGNWVTASKLIKWINGGK